MTIAIIVLSGIVLALLGINYALINRLLLLNHVPPMKPVQALPTPSSPEPQESKKPLWSVKLSD